MTRTKMLFASFVLLAAIITLNPQRVFADGTGCTFQQNQATWTTDQTACDLGCQLTMNCPGSSYSACMNFQELYDNNGCYYTYTDSGCSPCMGVGCYPNGYSCESDADCCGASICAGQVTGTPICSDPYA
jgi:hypothetical protein